MDEELKPGQITELIFKENEYDVFEKQLVLMNNSRDIYKSAAGWILREMKPDFVLFYAVIPGSNNPYRYFLKRKGIDSYAVKKCIKELINSHVNDSEIYILQNGGLTLPYTPKTKSNGFIFIGPCANGKLYKNHHLKKITPVIRILNKAFISFEAHHEISERARLQDAFSHYVSPDIVQDIIHNPGMLHLGGEKKFLTCIFTDLQGFTSLSDTMDPMVLVRVLNMYLNEMSQVIISLGGVIDKFEGDAIMAFFGAPHDLKDHAVRCCLAALRMKRMEIVLNEQLQCEKLIDKPLFTRIGVNSGDMVVGNVGSLQRLDYTIIGNNVNIASRLENANKEFGTGILISGTTYEIVKDYFDCRNMGEISLRGVSKPVLAYELCGLKKHVNLKYDNFPEYSSVAEDVEDVEDLQ